MELLFRSYKAANLYFAAGKLLKVLWQGQLPLVDLAVWQMVIC